MTICLVYKFKKKQKSLAVESLARISFKNCTVLYSTIQAELFINCNLFPQFSKKVPLLFSR